MPKIERGEWSDLLRRYLGMKGTSEISSELSPEISPTFVLEAERPEWEFLKGFRLAGAQFITSAVALENAAVRLRNPPDSGVVLVTSRLMFTTDTLTGAELERVNTTNDLTNLEAAAARDTRWPVAGIGNNVVGRVTWTTNFTPAGSPFAAFLAGVTVPQFYTDAIILTPGTACTLFTLGVNLTLNGFWAWLEKPLPRLEQRE